jgi:hypothetical protein
MTTNIEDIHHLKDYVNQKSPPMLRLQVLSGILKCGQFIGKLNKCIDFICTHTHKMIASKVAKGGNHC